MTHQKRVAAIHDISGFGKCSLTVALPILSAAGIETSVIPTAVLSTHTGGFTGYTYRDLTGDMKPFAEHWKSLGLTFDALYSGFLGSFEQISIVSDIFRMFRTDGNLILVDPVMADNGKLYPTYTPEMAGGMAQLCRSADIIVPNLTEAAFLLGREFFDGPYEKAYIEKVLRSLSKLGPKQVVLTGVWFDPGQLGAAGYDSETGRFSYAFAPRIEGFYHGTGDVFGSAMLSGLLNGLDLQGAMQLAVDFTCASIRRTKDAGTDVRFGVNFEAELPNLIRKLHL
ncbi:MAG TPA: pyridoxamine kinase [Ruminococcaceae bacterium]|jgi:pyridoxine kinase|nr:pyridoxamine kinase [Oscillospiraceae bacterium]